MPDLIAQGASTDQRWRRSLPSRRPVVIGRAAGWSVPWDRQVSRQHVEICWKHGRLQVTRLSDAANPVFTRGKSSDVFFLKPGEQFVIGSTVFTLADEKVTIAAGEISPITEQSYSPQFLHGLSFRNADQRIDVLSRLPSIIGEATSDSELFVRLVSVLMSGIPRASTVAIVACEPEGDQANRVRVLHWDRRSLSEEDFRPSRRLIAQAVATGKSVVHWLREQVEREEGMTFTQLDEGDWAFCTPVTGGSRLGWAIYATGKTASDSTTAEGVLPTADTDMKDDLKFAELVAGTLSSLSRLRKLERSQASLRQFLSPVVLEAVAEADWEEVLTPRECEVAVLFCDLRGFSRESERFSDDLHNLLERVSRALGVTTRHILDQNGVVGDFHGDAVMGFWGWPLEQPDAVGRAALTALAIRAEFEAAAHREGHSLVNFRIGIGIATGRAVAGKIGTADQVTVSVFGPVVNLAARLESMTKTVRTPILVDEATARAIDKTYSTDICRVRRIAKVRPYGLDRTLVISELLPPATELPYLSDEAVATFEHAVDEVFGFHSNPNWDKAFDLLHQLPVEDRTKDFLTVFMARHNRTPPSNWDGVIELESK